MCVTFNAGHHRPDNVFHVYIVTLRPVVFYHYFALFGLLDNAGDEEVGVLSCSVNIERAENGDRYLEIAAVALAQAFANCLGLGVGVEGLDGVPFVYGLVLWVPIHIGAEENEAGTIEPAKLQHI